MDETQQASSGSADRPYEPRCDAELHVRLCARRLRSGHLEFRWRIEHIDNIATDGSTLEGAFAAFQLPHEMAQELAGAARQWIKEVKRVHRERAITKSEMDEMQLTMSDALPQWERGG